MTFSFDFSSPEFNNTANNDTDWIQHAGVYAVNSVYFLPVRLSSPACLIFKSRSEAPGGGAGVVKQSPRV